MVKTFASIFLQTTNNDRASHKAVLSALEVIGFSEEEISSIYQILASILLLVSCSSECYTWDFSKLKMI